MNKAYIVGGWDGLYAGLLKGMGFAITTEAKEASFALFTGGEDVSPSFYGCSSHPYTHSNEYRDIEERKMYAYFYDKHVPMMGICRGGQFLNVMNGGIMYQHVSGHTQSHLITDVKTGLQVWASSTHHQMMKMASEGVLVASGAIVSDMEWYEGPVWHMDQRDDNVEVVFYPESKSLCFQPHPEFHGDVYDDLRTYLFSLLQRYEMV